MAKRGEGTCAGSDAGENTASAAEPRRKIPRQHHYTPPCLRTVPIASYNRYRYLFGRELLPSPRLNSRWLTLRSYLT